MNTPDLIPQSHNYETEAQAPSPEGYRQLYEELLEWCRKKELPRQDYNEPSVEGDPAVEHYILPVAGDDAIDQFGVPLEIREKNPRNFEVHVFTPRRFEEENELKSSIFVQYDFGPEDNQVGAYYLLDDEGGRYDQEELFDGDDWIEAVEKNYLDINDIERVKAIIAYATHEYSN